MLHLLQKKDMLNMAYEVYLASEEIKEFLNGSEKELLGYSYEWEGENVIHLHSHPLQHSFGLAKRCLFTRKDNINPSDFNGDINYIATISSKDNKFNIKVYKLGDSTVVEISAKLIPGKDELYSRSKGLLEVEILSKKHVVIVGLGSFGSQIAIELAKAGVGVFSLFDFDRVELKIGD